MKEKKAGKRAFVLLSGGIDSTTCLYQAVEEFGAWSVEGISIDYGQRHKKEIQFAKDNCQRLAVVHSTIDAAGLFGKTMLTDADAKIPSLSYEQIEGMSPTYVPFRNSLLLSIITARAQEWVVSRTAHLRKFQTEKEATELMRDSASVYFGAHAEDAHNWAYPDCTPEFIGAMANAIYIGTYMTTRLRAPLMWFTKADVVALAAELGVPLENTWSCYVGGEQHCGVCPTCRARQSAFEIAGVTDETFYLAT